jgi:hypothetical protein
MRYRALVFVCSAGLAGCADVTGPTAPPPAVGSAQQVAPPGNATLDGTWQSFLPPPTTVSFLAFDCNGQPIPGTAQQTIVTRTFTRNGNTFAFTVIGQRVTAMDAEGRKYAGTNVMATTTLVTPGKTTLTFFGDLDLFAVDENAPDVFLDLREVLTTGAPPKLTITMRCPAS